MPANVRIEIRTDEGSYVTGDTRTATPEQVEAAKALCLSITDDVSGDTAPQ